MIGVFEILYLGIQGVCVRGRHFGGEREMDTQATSKALLTTEVGYKFNFISLFIAFFLAFRCVFYVYPRMITVHLFQFLPSYPVISYTSAVSNYLFSLMLPLRPLTHLQCICANIRSCPTQPLNTCEAPSPPPNTQLSSASYTSSYPHLDSPSQNVAPAALKQPGPGLRTFFTSVYAIDGG
jgi:hypothetical protein